MAEKLPDTIAIYYPDKKILNNGFNYQTTTYRELKNNSNTYAKGLLQYGFNKGDRVVLMVTPSLDFFALTFALFKAGIVPILIDPGIGLKNLKECLNEAQPVGFIGVPKAQLARILFGWSRGSIKKIVNTGFSLNPNRALSAVFKLGQQSSFSLPETNPGDMAAIIFTSGSTGVPKGVVYSHENFVAQVELLQKTYNVREGEIDLPTFPLFALFNPALGMSSVIPVMDFTKPANIHPPFIIAAINKFQITNMFGSPALLNTLSIYCEANKIELHSLKRVISAGAPVQPKIVERLKKSFSSQACLYTPYGATESLPVSSADQDTITGIGKVGFALGRGVCIGHVCEGLEVKVIQISDSEVTNWNESLVLPGSNRGEIVVKGKNVTRSYFNREESTRLAKIQEGETFWHRMGDIGYFDEDDRLWFCGRKSHRVIVDDETLFSVCCEGVFNSHPDVYRSALVQLTQDGLNCAGICLEMEAGIDNKTLAVELNQLAQNNTQTKKIAQFFVHPSFPVDIRHNAKIDRGLLSQWAQSQWQKGRQL